MTTTFLRRAFAAAALAILATGCDSVPGALDPDPEGPATIAVHNAGSRTITAVYVKACPGNAAGYTRWVPVSIAPNRDWSRGWNTGCHTAEIQFNSGGEWNSGSLNLTAGATTTIYPF